MPEENQTAQSQSPPIPQPEKLLLEGGLSARHKRWIFFGVMGVIVLVILANLVGSHAGLPTPKQHGPTSQHQNPTDAQIRDMENNLRQQEAALRDEAAQATRQLRSARDAVSADGPGGMTADDLQRAAALQDAALARQQYQQLYGNQQGSQSQEAARQVQLKAEREQQAYKSLFADSLVRQDSAQQPSTFLKQQPETGTPPLPDAPRPTALPSASPEAQLKPASDVSGKALDFNPAGQQDYWLPEGTVIEAVLTNRLDGDGPGPVNAMITTDVYLPGTRLLLIPQGARVLGEASKVSTLGQQRLAIAFHRIIVPGLRTYSIPLDKEPPATGQGGEVGLHDKVNGHYASIFGASLAVGALGGLAQIGNGYSGFGYDPSVQFRNGITQSMGQSSDRILERFLNRMPTLTIREGTRVKILLTDDLQVPAYDSMHTGGM